MAELKTRILVVDDDQRLRDLLTRYLGEQKFEVRAVADAPAMDRLLSRERFDLIVLDLMLPGEDGLAICRRLRAAGGAPAIIMLTIPMAFAGAMVGLLVMRAPFDFFAILGLLSLAGVIINNGIVLIDRIDGMRAEGKEAFQSVVEATMSRCRPIVMSAVTTILGVLPLIVFHDPLFYSMACIIAFGLALGTVLSLLVVPVIYSLFFNVRDPSRGKTALAAPAGGAPVPSAG